MNKAKELILVTGCSGRIGMKLLDTFSDHACQIIGLDLHPPSQLHHNVHFIRTDISDDNSLQKAFDEIKERFGTAISSCIHLASYYNFEGGHWDKYEKNTIQGTEKLLKILQRYSVEQFLYASSMLVHAPIRSGDKIVENSPMLASWEYPKSKILAEELIHKQRGKIPILIFRIAGCYDDYCHSTPIAHQIQRIYENQFSSRVFPGNIHHGLSFVHLDDLAEAMKLAVEGRGKLPQELTLLIGEEAISYDELQRLISKLLRGKELVTLHIPKWFARCTAWLQNHIPFVSSTFVKPWMVDFADFNYDLDVSKIGKTLGWKPKRSLKTTLPFMIKMLQHHPHEWYKKNGLLPQRSMKSGCCCCRK